MVKIERDGNKENFNQIEVYYSTVAKIAYTLLF